MKLTIRKKRKTVVQSDHPKNTRAIASSVFCLFEDTITGLVYHCNMVVIYSQRKSRWGFWESMKPEVSDLFRLEMNREVKGFIEPPIIMEFAVNHATFEMDDDYEVRSLVYKFFRDLQRDHFREGTVMGVDGSILFDRAAA